MTESEWLTSQDPAEMLSFLAGVAHLPARMPLVSDRRLQLFACACADLAGGECAGLYGPEGEKIERPYAMAVWWTAESTRLGAAREPTQVDRANLLRDIVGNVFRPVTLTGQRWERDAIVYSLALAAFEQQSDGTLDPVRLCVLADALEEAGCVGQREWLCVPGPAGGQHSHPGKAGQVIHGILHDTNPQRPHHHHDEKCPRREVPHPILAHLRSPGPHVRGCWAVDLLLGKS